MRQLLRFVSYSWKILVCLYILESTGLAQSTKPLAQDKTNNNIKTENNEKEDSPRFMFRQFLNVLKREDVEAAMSYVEFPRRWNSERRRNTTRQMIEVLNKRARISLSDLSSEAEGRTSDGQAPDIEIIGQVFVDREIVPVTLVQVTKGDQKVWHFASEFIHRIPTLAEKMERSDIEADLPEILVDNQFYGIKLWQWLGMALALILASLVSRVLALVLLKIINFTSRRFKIFLTDASLKGFIPPLRMLTGLAVFKLAIDSVNLHLDVRQTLVYIMTVIFTLTLIFLTMRLTEALMDLMRLSFDRQGRPGSAAMLQPTQRGLKAIIIVVGIIFLLRNFGFDVTAIVAGLGVGGLAIALAGQKTIENLFGGISVILDQPVRVGDSGRFGEIVGTVEDIGLRSTRVRTLDRSIVTIPNAEFSHMKLENFERRDKLRWATNLFLRHDTSPDQMRLVLIRFKELLIGHSMVLNEPARVRFLRFAQLGLEIEIFTYIRTTDWNEYLAVVEDMNLRIMQLLRDCGTGLAFAVSATPVDAPIDCDMQLAMEREFQDLASKGGVPLPLYPQTWIEPRSDIIAFGDPKKDPEISNG